MGCIFCEIVAERVPASFVYQGEQIVAFMSLEQPNPYKVLIVPRAHIETIYDLNDEQAALIFQTTVRVAKAIRTISGCAGLNIIQSNGTAGQQDIFHFHLHLLPRFPGDTQQGRVLLSWDNTEATRSELDKLAHDLRSQMF